MQGYLSVADTAKRFNISNRRVQLLCEQNRIEGARMISGVWVIPALAQKPRDGRRKNEHDTNQMSLFDIDTKVNSQFLTFDEVCALLSISPATGRNWVKLGKIIPAQKDGRTLLFLRSEVDSILKAITSGKSNALSRRRNKKKINGLSAYENYISCSRNICLVNHIIAEYSDEINSAVLRCILANIAIQFICQNRGDNIAGNVISDYLHGEFALGPWSKLVDDLLGNKNEIHENVNLSSAVFSEKAEYIKEEDTLGFIYISLVNIGERKAFGAYYTPLPVVNKLVSQLADTTNISGKSVFDPCCGTGNFLLTIGEHTDTPKLIYGQDIDLTAVQLARISFALKYDITDMDFLYTHFTCADTLAISPCDSYDIVLGNPPWGGELTKDRLMVLANNYQTVVKNGTETYNLFIERGMSLLTEAGILAFVLPEAILNVTAHTVIRKILMNKCNFKFVQYLGNVFSGVQCPSIILGVEKTHNRTVGVDTVCLDKSNESFTIRSDRQKTVERFNFHVRDEVQDCLDALNELPCSNTLSENAKFALGIVTGDNASYISDVCLEGYEPVLKGSNVKKYKFETSENYIRFDPQSFQQVAPTELYRASEKLFYRFICETLVFAYDNRQTLSLNSCNILIPEIPNMNVKYVLGILNSRIANFYFINMFNSIKVLRSHIEQIPIPAATRSEQEQVISLVDNIIYGENDILKVYDELDNYIMSLYDFNSAKRNTIVTALEGRNLFLT